MPSTADILSSAYEQFDRDVKRLEAVNERMNKIREQFLEYRELDRQARELDERVRSQIGVFGDFFVDKKIENLSSELGITTTAKQEAANTPLWKKIREVVRQTTEIRMTELEQVMNTMGHEVTRQGIESALKTHKDIFRVARKGREVFVSLK